MGIVIVQHFTWRSIDIADSLPITGPMGVDFKPEHKADIDALFNTLEGKLQVIEPLPEPPRGAIGTDLGDGVLRGGNMTMLSMLLGTPYFLEDESWEDTLLFIEDVGGGSLIS